MQLQRVGQARVTGASRETTAVACIKRPVLIRGPAHPILQLQQTVGNQAVQRLIRAHLLQTKPAISQPGDIYEQEADRVAEQVMRMPAPTVQRACAPCAAGGAPCPKCEDEKKGALQRKPKQAADAVDASVPNNFLQNLGPGQPLDPSARAFFEPRFGYDFSHVRTHTGTKAAESARAVSALAYTVGRDVVFGAGQYRPDSAGGRRLLAHELIHVVQQSPATGSGVSRPEGPDDAQRQAAEPGEPLIQRVALGEAVERFFGGGTFSDEELRAYLAALRTRGTIEDAYDSDNKARKIVASWSVRAGEWPLDVRDKILLIREMMSGFTGDDDEQAILALLRGSTVDEVLDVFRTIGVDELEDEIHGSEFRDLLAFYRERAQPELRLGAEAGGGTVQFPDQLIPVPPGMPPLDVFSPPKTIDGVEVTRNFVGRCDLSKQAEIFYAYETAKAAVDGVEPRLYAYKEAAKKDPAILSDERNPVTRALRATFGLPNDPVAHGLVDIYKGLEDIYAAVLFIGPSLMGPPNTLCPSPDTNEEFNRAVCDNPTRGGRVVAGWLDFASAMLFCPPFFARGSLGQAWTLVHEHAHRQVTDARDPVTEIYCHQGSYPPSWTSARFHADCYAGLVMNLAHQMKCSTG